MAVLESIQEGDFVNEGRDKVNAAIAQIPASYSFNPANGILTITRQGGEVTDINLATAFPSFAQIANAVLPGLANYLTPGLIKLADPEDPSHLEAQDRVLSAADVIELLQKNEDAEGISYSRPSGSNQVIYRRVATLPLSGAGTYDHVFVELTGGGWGGYQKGVIRLFCANRGGFAYWWTREAMLPDALGCDLVCLAEAAGTVAVYVRLNRDFVAYSVKVYGLQADIEKSPDFMESPPGTVVFDSALPDQYPFRLATDDSGLRIELPSDSVNPEAFAAIEAGGQGRKITRLSFEQAKILTMPSFKETLQKDPKAKDETPEVKTIRVGNLPTVNSLNVIGVWIDTPNGKEPAGMTIAQLKTLLDQTSTNQGPVVANVIPDQTATVGQNFSYLIPANTFSDPDGQIISIEVTGLSGGLSYTAATRTVSGSPSAGGVATATVTATDNYGAKVSTTLKITISNPTEAPNQIPVVDNPLPAMTAIVGQPFSWIVPLNTFRDPEGQPLTYEWAFQLPEGFSFNPVTRELSGTPTVAGTYSSGVAVTDPRGGQTFSQFTFTVNYPGSTSGAPTWLERLGFSYDAVSKGYHVRARVSGSQQMEVRLTNPDGSAITGGSNFTSSNYYDLTAQTFQQYTLDKLFLSNSGSSVGLFKGKQIKIWLRNKNNTSEEYTTVQTLPQANTDGDYYIKSDTGPVLETTLTNLRITNGSDSGLPGTSEAFVWTTGSAPKLQLEGISPGAANTIIGWKDAISTSTTRTLGDGRTERRWRYNFGALTENERYRISGKLADDTKQLSFEFIEPAGTYDLTGSNLPDLVSEGMGGGDTIYKESVCNVNVGTITYSYSNGKVYLTFVPKSPAENGYGWFTTVNNVELPFGPAMTNYEVSENYYLTITVVHSKGKDVGSYTNANQRYITRWFQDDIWTGSADTLPT
ncbi:putative Ig domain-containing protein [Larkinella soli]|uniref:putative Ig domain-containing protein n=1 Tax=Larkinella soli TaxID=1770527 RepID=UPI000FFC858C|nr:putative Ig domain-containing protein [Larkinella soli]